MTLTERINQYEKLMRLDKPIGTLLVLWPTLWALWLSSKGSPNWIILWIFILGTVLMRSAGCVINDFADRDFDPHVERTKHRPLAAGLVSKKEALALFAVLVLLSFLLILRLNTLTLQLSVVALFLAASYPFTKRFFAIPQAYLGIAFGFGIPMGYAAQTGAVPAVAWAMVAANIFWAIAYDTEYAMVDRDDDLRIGIKTSAITFGEYDVLAVMLSYGAALVILAGVGFKLGLGGAYYAGLVAAACVAAYHYTLIRQRERAQCFKAFLHNNWFGAAVYSGIVVNYFNATMRGLRAFL